MDSDDDYQSLSPSKELSPHVQFRRLKRLKKSDNGAPKAPLFDSIDDPIFSSHVDFAKLEALENDSEPQFVTELNSTEDANLSQNSQSPGFGNEVEDDQLFSESNSIEEANLSQESPQGVGDEAENVNKMELGFDAEAKKTKRVLDFDDELVGASAIEEESENLEPEKKKELIGEEDLLEENKEKQKNKKKRREKNDGGDELKTKGTNKRREEKERVAYLKDLHAESQRLLRESGDAAFKPIPLVQKPISSVLEKIRKRKLEISKKSLISNDRDYGFERNIRPRDTLMDLDISNEERSKENVAIAVEKDMIAPLEKQSSLAASNVDEDDAKPAIHENVQIQVPASVEPTPALRAPADTQDIFDDSEPIVTTTIQNDDKLDSPLDEDFAPSLHAMNLKLDFVPVDDSSSEEEDNDKENSDPHPFGVADSSSPNGDPVKGFIDEQAEEEDDSDNDLNRFQENESDEDIDDLEELNDMIATAYEERHTDKETRNELHQKWLEQQDAAGTDNLIQRLKCGSVLKDVFGSDNEHETDEDDEMEEEIDDEAEEDSLPKESSKINIRQAKQIILKLYSDKEETYLSSDDDDDGMQRRRAQCLIRKEERATITSPAADASSREVFGLIKKLNITSDNKRKQKASLSIFDSVLKGGSSDLSTKSSFVGRVSNHHIPSSHKQGSATVRSFIFGRDDSNSRSSISVSDDSSNSVSREIRPTRNLATKYSNSQSKAINQTKDGDVETVSTTSLLEILKRSSQSKVCNEETAVVIDLGFARVANNDSKITTQGFTWFDQGDLRPRERKSMTFIML